MIREWVIQAYKLLYEKRGFLFPSVLPRTSALRLMFLYLQISYRLDIISKNAHTHSILSQRNAFGHMAKTDCFAIILVELLEKKPTPSAENLIRSIHSRSHHNHSHFWAGKYDFLCCTVICIQTCSCNSIHSIETVEKLGTDALSSCSATLPLLLPNYYRLPVLCSAVPFRHMAKCILMFD